MKELIARQLLAVCTEATSNSISRINDAKAKERKSDRIKEETIKRFNKVKTDWGSTLAEILSDIFAEGFQDDRFLSRSTKQLLDYDLFSVIKMPDKVPCILIHNKEGVGTLLLAGASHYQFYYSNLIRLATPEEVVGAIQSLDDAQWRYIRTNDVFAPIIEEALDSEITLKSEESQEEPPKTSDDIEPYNDGY